MQDAKLGNFAGGLLPGADQLRAATAAASIGQFPAFEGIASGGESRAFAVGLLSILKTGIAALLSWRVTPAALLSELGLALEIALEPSLSVKDAETMAIKYTERVRRLLHDASLTVPLDIEADPEGFHAAMAVYMRRDPALFAETRDGLGIQTVRPQLARTPASTPTGSSTAVCLRYATSATSECANPGKVCAYSHTCPFCQGAKCGNRAGYLSFHLEGLRSPLQLVARKAAQQQERAARGDWHHQQQPQQRPRGQRARRSRSRTRSPARRRQLQAAPAEPRVRMKEEEPPRGSSPR